MLKATQDFEYASVVVKAGDEIVPGTFEADQIPSLLRLELVVETEIKHEDPAPKSGKGKSK